MPLGRVRPLGMRQIIILLAALGAAFSALAQSPYPRPSGWEWYGTSIPNGTTGVAYTSGGATLTGGPSGGGTFIGRNFGQPSPNGVPMNETVRAPVGGNPITMNGARMIPLLEVANGAAALWAAWNAGQWVGSQIADYLDLGARVTPTANGWQFDKGQAEESGGTCQMYFGVCGALEGCRKYVAGVAASNTQWMWNPGYLSGSGTGLRCLGDKSSNGGTSYTPYVDTEIGLGTTQARPPRCPAYTDFFNSALSRPAGSAKDPDGMCRSGRYDGVPFVDARKRMQDFGNPQAIPELIPKIIEHGYPFAGEPMPGPLAGFPGGLTGPGSMPGPIQIVETTPSGGGAPVSTVNNSTVNYTYTGGNTVNVTNTTITNNPGGGTTTTTQTPEIKLCGLPGSPACKIDETGTPTTAPDGSKGIIDALKLPTQVASDPGSFFPKLPTLNWAFSLPTGCGPIMLPAFAPFLTSVDICPFQPTFHDLMTVVWVIGGLFGAVQLFLKDALAS